MYKRCVKHVSTVPPQIVRIASQSANLVLPRKRRRLLPGLKCGGSTERAQGVHGKPVAVATALHHHECDLCCGMAVNIHG